MDSSGVTKQIARWTALSALFLLPLTPLMVADSYFFPFITGKAFYLRILIEIAVAAWVVLALVDKEYRPRFSWIGAAVTAFVLWMFVADVFAVNPLKAFWSNFERMEGWVLLAHLLGLFFASSAVLRVEKKWRAWFLTSLGVAVVLSGYALLQLNGSLTIHQGSTRIDATLGNSAYFAIYLLFSTFVALWLALTEKISWLKWSLIALAVLEATLIFFTETRGTVLGLVIGLGLAASLTLLTAGGHARRIAAGACVLLLIIIGTFYLARDSSFVQGNHALQRVASMSLADGNTRFTIWGMALKGVSERPILGWGQEGFNYVFNKYYDPSLYAQEQWFDRAHNAFIDWLTAGGVLAFLLYLSLFGSALALLWRRSELSRPERTLLTAALVGYAIHNVFVFDNLYSYIYFFAILAFIDSQTARPIGWFERMPVLSSTAATTYALPITIVLTVGVLWTVNFTGMNTASKLIVAMSPSDDLTKNLTTFESLTTGSNFAAQEVREQMVSFALAAAQSPSLPVELKQRAVSLAGSEMQKQVLAYPLDAREHIQLSYVYRAAGDAANALQEIKAAQLLSPKKEGFLLEEGNLAWDVGELKAAQAAFTAAYALGPQFQDLALYAAAGNIAAGDEAAGNKILLDTFGTIQVDSDVLSLAYYRGKNWPRLIGLWKVRAEKPDASVETLFSLAAAYYAAGDRASSIKTVNAAITKYPDAAAAGAAAIKQIQGQ